MWGKPSLILIDGGKGQLDAAITARNEMKHQTIPCIGLAKREEQIVIKKTGSQVALNMQVVQKLGGFATESDDFILINLPHSTNLIKLLQRIRDESHRFAVSYHSVLKVRRVAVSLLDEVPTIGPETRKKLLRAFGSVRGVGQAEDFEIERVIGVKRAALLKAYLQKEPPKS